MLISIVSICEASIIISSESSVSKADSLISSLIIFEQFLSVTSPPTTTTVALFTFSRTTPDAETVNVLPSILRFLIVTVSSTEASSENLAPSKSIVPFLAWSICSVRVFFSFSTAGFEVPPPLLFDGSSQLKNNAAHKIQPNSFNPFFMNSPLQ